MKLKDRVAIVTGAASGIGRASAIAFAREGARVVVADHDERGRRETAEAIRAEGHEAYFARVDVTREAEIANMVEETVERWGRIDVLFNNAGVLLVKTIEQMSEEEWDRVMAVNVKAIFLMCREIIPVMAASGGGCIINTASGWGLAGGPRAAVYCASKGAVVLLTKAMAVDHGVQNIRVNCICPGDTDTNMLRNEAQQLGEPSDRFLAESARRPLGRVGKPDEIAQAALYLASDASSFVTGTALVVDGGGLAGSV